MTNYLAPMNRRRDEAKRLREQGLTYVPKSVALGETAAEVIASVRSQGHDKAPTSLRKGNGKRHRGSIAA